MLTILLGLIVFVMIRIDVKHYLFKKRKQEIQITNSI
jgi:hypothetical protein